MSVNFDPRHRPISVNSQVPSPPPKPGFFARWFELIHEGNLIERMPSRDYCKMKYKIGDADSKSPQTEEDFMRKCIEQCEFYKTFSDWHRRN